MTRHRLLRPAVSLLSLAALAWLLDPAAVASSFRSFHPIAVAAALMLSVLQTVLSAWRWRFTAHRLGLALPLATAVREYYLASFLNQALPGGVLGDLSRAWRHGRQRQESGERPGARALRAVVLERVSGQVVMVATALLSLAWMPAPGSSAARPLVPLAVGLLVALAVIATGLRLAARNRETPVATRLADWGDETRRALWSPEVLPVQVVSSALVVASYLLVYLAAARAIGVETPPALLLPLVAPVLMTMLLPVSVAGWGVREGAAAMLWGAVGLPPAEGVAVSVAYGLLVLVATLPGALVASGLWRGR